ncbi:MAG: phbZ [Anaerocolumna sp.]|jgi:poly(hydroxyalkanoate) depolymerase family esterase|nr:phbZ [Anaerocolumna sp.]
MKSNSMKKLSLLLVVMLIISLFPITTYASEGTFTKVTYGSRYYKVYVPSTYDGVTEVPLMVMLHGGLQDPDKFAAGTKMNLLAEEKNFIVIYPDQPDTANSSKCWNWFETAHQHRGSGEPALIVGMINEVKLNYNINDDMVYAAGLSAGGAMSVVLAATYPDVIHGIGVGAGLEYIAATSMMGAFTAMSSGGPNPNTQGVLAYNEMAKSIASLMPVIVFQGTSDYTVNIQNGHQIISQWAQTNDLTDDGEDNNSIDDTADVVQNKSVEGGRTYTRYAYEDAAGNILMEKYLVDGMGHAWSGGSSAGNYTDGTGPDATSIIWSFLTGEIIEEPEDPEDPGDPGDPTVIVAYGTATEHYVAGRLDVSGYLAMGTKYGYIAKFNLYQLEGTNVWTDIY